MSFPELNSAEVEQLERTRARIAQAIEAAGGALPFDRYMELALYGPGIGYYVNGAHKFGAGGDFVTAPELSPLFGQCLAEQLAEVLPACGNQVMEFGAGSGALAADILAHLERIERLPERYLVMELSAELRLRQQALLAERVPHLLSRVEWLERLPMGGWQGVVVANELLDAMPVSRFRRASHGWEEQRVRNGEDGFEIRWDVPCTPALVAALEGIQRRLGPFADGYCSEVNLRLSPWMRALAGMLERGLVLLIDYGYSEREYYHPERDGGTLMCHFRHRAHEDPLLLPGLQDITASVDFSAVAEAGTAAGLELAGYATQAQFLLGCGLDRLLEAADTADPEDRIDRLQAAKQLVLPSAMGERFKVIGFSRGLEERPLRGFALRDMRAAL